MIFDRFEFTLYLAVGGLAAGRVVDVARALFCVVARGVYLGSFPELRERGDTNAVLLYELK